MARAKNQATPARDKLDAVGMDEICRRTAECESLRKIAVSIGVSWQSAIDYLNATPERSEQYARARQSQADKFAEDIIEIADDGARDTYVDDDGNRRVDHDHIARARLRVDARKWLASKMAPKKYGDRLDVDAKVSGTVVIQASALDERI